MHRCLLAIRTVTRTPRKMDLGLIARQKTWTNDLRFSTRNLPRDRSRPTRGSRASLFLRASGTLQSIHIRSVFVIHLGSACPTTDLKSGNFGSERRCFARRPERVLSPFPRYRRSRSGSPRNCRRPLSASLELDLKANADRFGITFGKAFWRDDAAFLCCDTSNKREAVRTGDDQAAYYAVILECLDAVQRRRREWGTQGGTGRQACPSCPSERLLPRGLRHTSSRQKPWP